MAFAALTIATAGPTWAHHSAAMFDPAKTQRITGEVTAIEWTNPHVWLSIKAGSAEADAGRIWHFEMVGPGALARLGFTKDMFKAGTHVTAEHHPLRDGRPGGQLLTITFAGGRALPVVATAATAPK